MKRNTTARVVMKAALPLLALAVVLSFCIQAFSSQPVEALSITTTTAKSNQEGGNNILGGEPTRITWEASVEKGETVTEVTLDFPEGSSVLSDANAKATILQQDDPRRAAKRIEVEQNYTIFNEGTTVVFAEPIAEGLIIRLEVYNVAFPPEGGEFSLVGRYVDGISGLTKELANSPVITVIPVTPVEQIVAWLDGQEWVQAWNSNLFLRVFFNPQLIVSSIPYLFVGWLRSLGLVLVGFPLAIPIGLAFAFLRMARYRILRILGGIYVNVVRGTPLFLQIYIAFIGLPLLGISLDNYLLGILVLALNSSAYLAEIFRAGIQSIHKGQFEASASLGMNGAKTMFFVIIPQTIRRVIPTATSEFILLYKDTSLLAAVGVMEQMMFAKNMVANTANMTPYIVAACYYLIITLPLTKIISSFEKKLAAADGTTSAPPTKKKRKFFSKFDDAQTEPASLAASVESSTPSATGSSVGGGGDPQAQAPPYDLIKEDKR